LQYARDLLGALRWDGVAHLGFFVDKARKKVWYMETNGRFWASIEGLVHAGWDDPGPAFHEYWYVRKQLWGTLRRKLAAAEAAPAPPSTQVVRISSLEALLRKQEERASKSDREQRTR